MVEGAPHTAKERFVDQLVCHGVPPAPVYKGARGEEAAGQGGRAKGGVLLPPFFPSWNRRRGERGGRGEGRGGAAPLPLSYSD